MRSKPGTVIRPSRTLSSLATPSALKDAAVEHEPIVVTGVGCVSALGHSVEAFWSALQDGRCGLRKRDESALSDLKVSPVGAIPAPDPRHMLDARRLPITGPFQRIGDRCSSAGPGTVGSVHGHASGASGS